MSSERQDGPTGLPVDHLPITDTEAFAAPWRRRLVILAIAIGLVTAANLFLVSPTFWRAVEASHAPLYSSYHPVALQISNNFSAPDWARGGTVAIGASTLGVGIPQELSEEMLGERIWTVWVAGANPPEMLALAPLAARPRPRQAVIVLTVHNVCWGADSAFARLNRLAYVGPLSPAQSYMLELDAPTWSERIETLPAFRLREPLRALAYAYVRGRIVQRRRPGGHAWQGSDRNWNSFMAQEALERWRQEPSVERYQSYQRAVGAARQSLVQFWTDLRRVRVDTTGDSPNVRALRELTAYLRARDVDVRWVLFPENRFYGRLPGLDGEIIAPAEVIEPSRRLMRQLADELDVPFLDLFDLCEPDEFVDLFHLAPTARPKLAAALRPFVFAVPPHSTPRT